jgi:hypothetical protein
MSATAPTAAAEATKRRLTGEERAWLAGLLEGEGWFGWKGSPAIVVTMTDRDVVARATKLMGAKRTVRRRRVANYQTTYTSGVYGRSALDLMADLEPLMGHRRRERIHELLERHGNHYADRVCGGCGCTFTATNVLQEACSRK